MVLGLTNGEFLWIGVLVKDCEGWWWRDTRTRLFRHSPEAFGQDDDLLSGDVIFL